MDVEAIRRYCLSFPKATENIQWGDDLCFKINGKIFATVNLDVSSSVRIVFKCTPEQAAELIERPGISPAPYVGRYHWVALESLDSLSSNELKECIRNSYELVSNGANRKPTLNSAGPTKRTTAVSKPRKSTKSGR